MTYLSEDKSSKWRQVLQSIMKNVEKLTQTPTWFTNYSCKRQFLTLFTIPFKWKIMVISWTIDRRMALTATKAVAHNSISITLFVDLIAVFYFMNSKYIFHNKKKLLYHCNLNEKMTSL
jgi:hypothetical protein